MKKAGDAVKVLGKLRIPTEVMEVKDENSLESVFEVFAHIKAREKGKQIIVNLGSSTGMLGCAALSAAFVNGLKAFEIMDEKLILFPILKFSYYDMLSDKKMKLLKLLYGNDCCASLEELGKKANIGPSLVNYHVYGNEKNPGLKELGLIEIERTKGKVSLTLTTLGKLLLKQKEEGT